MIVPESIRAELGDPVLVRRIQSSPRSDVSVVEFAGQPAVVKRVTGGADADDRFRIEVAALRSAGRMTPAPVAALLAADEAERLLVLEYLGGGTTARPWSVEYATALARLHGVPPGDDVPTYRPPTGAGAFLRLAARFGVPVPRSVEAEVQALLDGLAGDALLHGDPCPDNAVVTGTGVRFVDLEGARRGPGALEVAYLRTGFPTCWCVRALPPRHVAEAEEAYRALRPVTAEDLADACIAWLVQGDALVQRAERHGPDHFDRLTRRDWEWGTATARERLLHRLGVVAGLATHRPRIAELAGHLSAAARSRWPGSSAVPATADNPLDPA
ncbi:phosphotransferase [Actinoplanes sp. CA-252034]|uniref:phosphotransferase n=1 Tax=Actinoplanes sp. CA-252034 TaxID=3239906 RepID=UPI003D997273